MKVLHIITGLGTGGAEMMLFKLLVASNKDIEHIVISLTGSGEMGKRIEQRGVPVIDLGMHSIVSGVSGFFRLVREIKKRSPDVIQTWMYHADLIGGMAAKLAGFRKIIWNIRNSDLDPEKTKLHTRLTVRACAFLSRWIPEKIICNSNRSAQIHQQAGYEKGKIVIIPNGFDLKLFLSDQTRRKDVRRESGIDENIFLIGLIARFDPQKNHKGFIDAATLLKKKVSHVHFLLCGHQVDNNNDQLIQWICSAGLVDAFHLLGPRQDIHRITAALDVATSSSSYGEAFPNVIGEAMACGVPCVVTDVGDSAWIVGDTGLVVAPDDPAALAVAWERLLLKSDDERQELGKLARKRIEENFSIETIARQYTNLYQEVAG